MYDYDEIDTDIEFEMLYEQHKRKRLIIILAIITFLVFFIAFSVVCVFYGYKIFPHLIEINDIDNIIIGDYYN